MSHHAVKLGGQSASMAAANAGRINHAEPGPFDTSVLQQQANHRSEAIWNRQGPLPAVAVVKSSPIERQWWTIESLTSLRHLVWRDSSGSRVERLTMA
nr:hypothetical protein CFP56_15357 [Quercus suber]